MLFPVFVQNVFETLIGKKQQLMLATQVCKMILKVCTRAVVALPNSRGSWCTDCTAAMSVTQATNLESQQSTGGDVPAGTTCVPHHPTLLPALLYPFRLMTSSSPASTSKCTRVE